MLKVHLSLVSFKILIVVLVRAALVENDSEAQILSNEYNIDEKGNYKFSFETSNGITREEIGRIVDEGQPDQHLHVEGRSTYIDPEGKQETIWYIADEKGYRILTPGSESDHKIIESPAPPLPGAVVASLLGK